MAAMDRPTILAAADDPAAAAALDRALQEEGGIAADVRPVALGLAVSALRAGEGQIAVLFLDRLDEVGEGLVRDAVAARPDVPVLVALAKVEKSTLVSLVKLGAADVLDFPLVPHEVRATFATLIARQAPDRPSHGSRIWSVFGAGGGCGVTTVAVNLAERLAHRGGRVGILDLNLELGDVAVFLNMKPRYTLTDLVQNVGKLDGAYLSSAISTHGSGLRVVPGPREIEESEDVRPERLRAILRPLRAAFDHLVIDTPSVFNETAIEALDHSDGVLLVAMLSIPSVRNAKRIRAAFDRLKYPASKIRLVVNRFEKKADISVDEAAALVGLPVFHTIPNDYPSVIRAINVGEPVAAVSPRALVTRAIEALAEKLRNDGKGAEPAAAPPAAKTGGFFSGRGKSSKEG